MAILLNDAELRKLLNTVILDGDPSCVRSNSYVLRLGATGEFLNSSKEFNLSKKKKGIRIHPGESVAVTALETIDFRRDTVQQIFPDCDLHALVSPTTDLSREGIVSQSTHVDAGFFGTLNWTLSNTSDEERRFLFEERIFRIVVFRLSEGERPDVLYAGDYQAKTGYVRSQRKGAPVGMKESDWEDGFTKGGPEDLLEKLIRKGYPWNILGERLQIIDRQFKQITDEYGGILDSLNEVKGELAEIRKKEDKLEGVVRQVLRDEADSLQKSWLFAIFTSVAALVGFGFLVFSSPAAVEVIRNYPVWIGLVLLITALLGYLIFLRPKSKSKN